MDETLSDLDDSLIFDKDEFLDEKPKRKKRGEALADGLARQQDDVMHLFLPFHPGTCFVLHPDIDSPDQSLFSAQDLLDEGVGLASAIELKVTHAEIIPIRKVKPKALLGQGTIDRIFEILQEKKPEVIIINGTVSPIQQRNLEQAWQCKVLDRTGLILEIFAARARTYEGSLQVELARLTYRKGRLVRAWTHLERQKGGFGFMGGPGETQIELDRRMIDEKIAKLKIQLESVVKTRSLHRQARARIPYPIIALVGYTNAGKSTLFNTLTKADVFAKDLLFATLDPTMRQIKLPQGMPAILSDTVGFIAELPTQLIAAFRATLEEVTQADLILFVEDMSHPCAEAQRAEVEKILKELGTTAPLLHVLNKIDLMDESARELLKIYLDDNENALAVSAITGEGMPELRLALRDTLTKNNAVVEITLSVSEGKKLAWLYANAEIMTRTDDDENIYLAVRMSPTALGLWAQLN